MKEIDPGHIYFLDNLDGDEKQKLIFVKRIGNGYPGNTPPAFEGTACQKVLRANIHRVAYLQRQFWCAENVLILLCLKLAVWAFEFRASRRKKRILLVNPLSAWEKPVCHICNHISCNHVE